MNEIAIMFQGDSAKNEVFDAKYEYLSQKRESLTYQKYCNS